jgi:hypothetical protein
MRERVLKDAIEKGQEQIGSPEWLNVNDTFDHGRELSDPEAVRRANILLEILPIQRRRRRDWDKKQADIQILCANLLANKSKRFATRKPLALPLHPKHYSPNRYRRASPFVTVLVKAMAEDGWIDLAKGYHNSKGGRMTRIWPTQKFLDHFTPFDQVDFRPLELVNLRDENGQDKDYKDTPETTRIREALRRINSVNRQSLVQLKLSKGFQKLSTDLYAVFNGSFEQGGRLYTGKNGYQALFKEERPHIWIDRSPTVELDFSGMQPRLLYALEGIQFDEDPYTIVSDYPELRPFLKQLLLALLNADSLDKAVASGNYQLHLDHDLYQTLKAIGQRTAELIDRFKQAHPAIAHHFCLGMGLKLMRLDARIALEVLENFTSQGLPILSIHDSFIVQRNYRDDLQKAMQAAYRKHTGGFTCPIKEG